MPFTNGQNVQAADLNNLSVTTVTTSGAATVGGNLSVTGTAAITGNTTITGSLTVGGVPISASVARSLASGRLTLTSGTPVTDADVTAATTLYWALYKGNQIALYSGTEWLSFAIAQLSIAVPATTNQMYDVFVNYNAGTPALAVTAWTNDTTRATALTTQDGVLVKSGSTGQRYVGSFRTTGVSGQTEDSIAKRLVWNFYNRVERDLRVLEGTDSWTYTTATWRQANNAAANKLAFVMGVTEDVVKARVIVNATNSGGAQVTVAIGVDSTTTPSTACLRSSVIPGTAATNDVVLASLEIRSAIGFHEWVWLEHSVAAGATTWYGDNGGTTVVSGITGTVWG